MFLLFLSVMIAEAIAFCTLIICQYVHLFKYEINEKNKDKKPKPEDRIFFKMMCNIVLFGVFMIFVMAIALILDITCVSLAIQDLQGATK